MDMNSKSSYNLSANVYADYLNVWQYLNSVNLIIIGLKPKIAAQLIFSSAIPFTTLDVC